MEINIMIFIKYHNNIILYLYDLFMFKVDCPIEVYLKKKKNY